ncbi:MAG: hypothetical protein FJ347_02935 [Sphingomonadales bacterium]|nr:hypothetical protein [Sphingomonadales bacterium]
MDKKKVFFWLLLCISIVAKIFLLGKGYLSFPDEVRYVAAQNFIEELKQGNLNSGIGQIFEVQGRPGLVIASILPAGVQIVLSNYLMIPYNSATSAWVIYIFNLVVYLLILSNIYHLALKLGLNVYQALLVLILYSVSLNGYIYLRHTFPYDTSLLLGLLAFNFLLGKNPKTLRSLVFQGLSISACFLVYPGYYPLVLAFGLYWFYQNRESFKSTIWIKQGLIFSTAFVLPFLIIEGLAGMCGKSYFFDARQLSQTIIEGSFEEGFSFLFKYLWQVENGVGLIYIMGLAALLFLVLKRSLKTKTDPGHAEFLFISMLIGFVIYAGLVFFMHKMVFYGRIIHQFMPFMALFTVYGLFEIIQSEKFRKQITWALPIALLGLSTPAYSQYSGMEYPRDFFNRVNRNGNLKAREIEYRCQWLKSLPRNEKFADSSNIKYPKIILVNWCHPAGDSSVNGKIWNTFDLAPGQKVIAKAPHYMSYIGYQFEGANIQQRQNTASNPPMLEIYAELK